MLKDIKKIILSQRIAANSKLISLQEELNEQEKFAVKYKDYNKEEIEAQIGKLSVELDERLAEKKSAFYAIFENRKRKQAIRDLQIKIGKLVEVSKFFTTMNLYKEEINKTLEEIEYEVEKNKSIKDFNMSFYDAKKFLFENGIEPVLDESDKYIIENNSELNKLSDFILVHKTRYLPENSYIKTASETGVKETAFISDDIRDVEYLKGRNTIHWAVNGEVYSHSNGNWDDCKYAILTPLEQMPLDKLRSYASMDTYFEGSISLPPGSMLLCPIEEMDEAVKLNPGLNVLPYKGNNALNYANVMVSMLGYKLEGIGMWCWTNKDDEKKYYDILENVCPNATNSSHNVTFEYAEETTLSDVSTFESVIEEIFEKKIQCTKENFVEILKSNITLCKNDMNLENRNKLFNEVILKLQGFLQPYNIRISESVITRIKEILNDEVEVITKEERNLMKEAYNYHDINLYIPPIRYTNFLLKYDILSSVLKLKESESFLTDYEKERVV